MSCRHDLALGTCAVCYPGGTVDPGPGPFVPNLEGPGASVAPAKSMAKRLMKGEICKRCGRYVVCGFSAPDELWASVVNSRWNVLCLPCFDAVAQAKRVSYSASQISLHLVTWSEWEENP